MTASNNLVKNDIHNLFVDYSELKDQIKLKKQQLEINENQLSRIIVKIEGKMRYFDKYEDKKLWVISILMILKLYRSLI